MAAGQPGTAVDPKLQGQLKQLFPPATFSPKISDPPHYKAFAPNPQSVTGLAFWTTEIEPLERGYDGPIKILVGMDTKGILTGIIVASHNEPYGDFSVDRPEFAAQFKGKSIRDPFRVGADVDATDDMFVVGWSETYQGSSTDYDPYAAYIDDDEDATPRR